MIQMYNVTKTYSSGVEALRGINLGIKKGEFVYLVGPSGAGKTTLMRLIYRDELPTSGHVVIDGRNIERLHESRVPYLRRSVGVVFQDFRLIETKTVFNNVAFALRVVGAPSDEVNEKTHRVLEMLGLKHKANLYPSQISAGEKQRVCIARALVNDPAILVTDEPTGNLDPELATDIMRILMEINNRGTTVLMATHNMGLVEQFARRIVHLVAGKVISDQEKVPRSAD
ncbi:MAG: cell division ATP-binding protein FtsE [Candidatus Riflebacteria bacterium]|nr:cell division ATP-binding protein FtsE [Candidatus Riflebacteria bacterium]